MSRVRKWHVYLRACHKKTQRERRRKGQRRERTMDICNVVDDSVSVTGHVELLKMHLLLLLGWLCQLAMAMAMALGIFGVRLTEITCGEGPRFWKCCQRKGACRAC